MVDRLVKLVMFFCFPVVSVSCSQGRHFSDVSELSVERGAYFDKEVVLDAALVIDVDGAAKACSLRQLDNCIYLVVSTNLYRQLKGAEITYATIYGRYKEHGFVAEGDELKMLPSRIVVDQIKSKTGYLKYPKKQKH